MISPAFSTVRDRILSFSLLLLTSVREIENRLRNTWDRLNRKLAWMFRDQAVAWKLMREISQGNLEQRSGEARMKLEGFEAIWFIKYCGCGIHVIGTWVDCAGHSYSQPSQG